MENLYNNKKLYIIDAGAEQVVRPDILLKLGGKRTTSLHSSRTRQGARVTLDLRVPANGKKSCHRKRAKTTHASLFAGVNVVRSAR